MLNHTKRQGNIKTTTMFITAVCIVFLIKFHYCPAIFATWCASGSISVKSPLSSEFFQKIDSTHHSS